MNVKQDTEKVPIKCTQCGKTLAFKSLNLRIDLGEIAIKCRNCKTMNIITAKT
ncbi:MAG: hypothetical protein II059_05595 [Clostridia bacterium]|nr:hypothetical protein [Clostridia bacterium]